jgi:hypothetical protein
MTYAGKPVTKEQVSGTVKLLRYYRRFLQSVEHDRCASPEERGIILTKEQARNRLHYLVEVAINRKAGIPDVTQDERDEFIKLWRDSRRIQEIKSRRIRHYQFETETARSRFGHLLSRYDD